MKIGKNSEEQHAWESLRDGNQSALRCLYIAYYKRFIQFGMKYTQDHDLLKDSINNTFLYLWEKHESLSPVSYVSAYLYRSFQRQLFKDLKSKSKNQAYNTLEELPELSEEKELHFIRSQEENRRIEQLKKAIKRLPQRQRELIFLRYFEELSYDEIMERTQLTKRSIYNQIHTAINTLKNDSTVLDLKPTLINSCSIIIFFLFHW